MPKQKKKQPRELLRNRLEVDERRAQLLALGLELFSQSPYDELKIDAIAEKAGISKGLLYHYFPTKRAFYVAILREAAKDLLQVTAFNQESPPLARAQQGTDAYLCYVETHRVAYVALLRGGVGFDAEVSAVIEDTRTQFLARITQGMGVATPLPPLWRLALRGWIGFVEASSLEWAASPEVSKEKLRELILANLLATISAISSQG
jgi:AcrR family transcriptional regulator